MNGVEWLILRRTFSVNYHVKNIPHDRTLRSINEHLVSPHLVWSKSFLILFDPPFSVQCLHFSNCYSFHWTHWYRLCRVRWTVKKYSFCWVLHWYLILYSLHHQHYFRWPSLQSIFFCRRHWFHYSSISTRHHFVSLPWGPHIVLLV